MNASLAADRGGPVACGHGESRNWMRDSAPGIAFRRSVGESSPIRGEASSTASPTIGATALSGSTSRDRLGTPSFVSATADSIRRHRGLTIFCIVLLAVLGLASTGHGLYIMAKAQLAQVLLHSAWERTREAGAPAKPWPWADTHPVARLIVPARDADLLVLAGASGRTLAFGPGHLDGSAQPGEPGNAVLTAHRDTHFRFLRKVAANDVIIIERADGSQRQFRVRDTYVADHRSLHLPRDTARPTLTLVTCFPFDALDAGGPLRYVVVAEAAADVVRPMAAVEVAGSAWPMNPIGAGT